jgi:hypothetical protein
MMPVAVRLYERRSISVEQEALLFTIVQRIGRPAEVIGPDRGGKAVDRIVGHSDKLFFVVERHDRNAAMPVRRMGTPEDIANACAWLVHDAMSPARRSG